VVVSDGQYRRFVAALHVAAHLYPDLGLGEIIVNACGGDPSVIGDENFVDALWGYVAQVAPDLPDVNPLYR